MNLPGFQDPFQGGMLMAFQFDWPRLPFRPRFLTFVLVLAAFGAVFLTDQPARGDFRDVVGRLSGTVAAARVQRLAFPDAGIVK